MLSDFAVPFIMASIFTAGCMLIHISKHRAERVGEVLSITLLLCVILCFMTVAKRHVIESVSSSEQQVGNADASHASAFDAATAVNWSD